MVMVMTSEWTWVTLVAAVLVAVLVPLALHLVLQLSKKKQRQLAAQAQRATRTLEDYMQDGLSEEDAKFQVAVDFAATLPSSKLSNEQRLTMYAFYKQALLGQCTETTSPSAIDVVARAKWESWKALGSMASADAKRQYVVLLQELFPSFDVTGHTTVTHPLAAQIHTDVDKGGDAMSSAAAMAGVVSMPTVDRSAPEWQVKEDLFHFASTGEQDRIAQALASGGDVDAQDEEGRTMLHWAVDRSQAEIVALLLQHHAAVNAQDTDGMTPLHYAVSCEDEEMVKLLVGHGASRDMADNDGETPLMCAASPAMQAILSH